MILNDDTFRGSVRIDLHKVNGRHVALIKDEPDSLVSRDLADALPSALEDIIKELDESVAENAAILTSVEAA